MRRLALAALALLALALPLSAFARAEFMPNDPLAPKQYYLAQDHAFDWFDTLPALNPVRVAIIDSGIDANHPEFPHTRILAGKSFVGGTWQTDENGHGTFVAGEIAAAINNGQGIAGIAFPAQLIISKIARADSSISVTDEAAAIRWAVDHGAQVINLSFGGVRDPLNPANDTFAPEEAAAVEYAVRHGAVVVAAVGNSDDAPRTPWTWADYPAALPHVIGVSALLPTGSVPAFSDRDQIYNDISAPGQGILSTLPLTLTKQFPTCTDQGYSDCGPDAFRPDHAAGTSFAAPQVTAAAALMLSIRPSLKADQISNILERTATDVNASNGCPSCPVGRDALSGWGRLNIQAAAAAVQPGVALPPPDRLEPNDDAGREAATLSATTKKVTATLDYWDDQIDVYRVHLVAHRHVLLRVTATGMRTDLLLWRSGTVHVNDLRTQRLRIAQSTRKGSTQAIRYRVAKTGWYYVEVKLPTRGFGPYALSITR